MIEYCTLFDANYLAQGLALYESMDKHHKDYRLHILALCDKSYKTLERLALPNVTLYSVAEVETAALRRLHSKLSHFEYACALKPDLILRVLQVSDHVVYIDADSYFFGTGRHLIDSLRDSSISIAITPHRFTPDYKHFLKNGVFNAGFIYATQAGIPCLEDWGRRCISDRTGPMTDQRLLNGWPGQWNAHIIKHKGINLAPWNQAEQYHYSIQDGQVYVDNDPLVWYHFHRGMKPSYWLDTFVVDNLYNPYEEALQLHGGKKLVRGKRRAGKPTQKSVQSPRPRPIPPIQPLQGIVRNYCTYFDSEHLVSFLAMHDSMVKWCKPFKLWAMPIDDPTPDILKRLNLENVNIVPMFYKSNQNVRDLKRRLNYDEYIHVLKPLLIQYMMKQDIGSITYLDSNGYFFSRPDSLYGEISGANIAIAPHRFSSQYVGKIQTVGKFNAGFMYFKKGNIQAFDCVVRWCKQVMAHCETSAGHFLDQKYLEEWPERWGAHIISHKGVNLAPWNQLGQYKYEMRGSSHNYHLYVDNDPLIWYNFNQDRDYKIDGLLRSEIYTQYEKALGEARGRV